MRRFFYIFLGIFFLMPTAARAENPPGIAYHDFRLGLSGGLYGYTSLRESKGADRFESSFYQIGLTSPKAYLSNFTWTMGYAVTQQLELGTHIMFDLNHQKTENSVQTGNEFWGLFYFHYNYPINRLLYFSPEAMLGYMSVDSGNSEVSGVNFGMGVGINYFLTNSSTLDLSLDYLFGNLIKSVDNDPTDSDITAHVIMIRLGLSLWMGGNHKHKGL